MQTKIIALGATAPELIKNGILIMFNPNAPAELKDIAALHQKLDHQTQVLHVGGSISFDDQQFQIDFVGSEANRNFDELDHISIYFNNTDEDMNKLPGSIFVSSTQWTVPTIQPNQLVTIK